ncbi:MAG: helix-turn-helix domain-containing protein [Ktedonobacteraceae bacterium]|nr:helix-turn-helix domain-containing protein [Ktedonobacteraceae bacterium]
MSFGARLRQKRRHRHLSQEALADALGISVKSICRWERDQALPQGYSRLQLSRFFNLSPDELFGDHEEEGTLTPLWEVPYPRNPFFTEREDFLFQLHELLNQKQGIALSQSWVVSGLAGVGKTQVALEYAYRYRQNYRFVFWTSATTWETLQAGIASIADLLQLPEHNEQDQSKVLQAVRKWFVSHGEWLWILDDANDVEMVQNIISMQHDGHLLLTSRAQAWGSLAQRIEIKTMGLAEGTLFLLRRAKLLAHNAFLDAVDEKDLAAAEAVVLSLDFLPLALDQAGAYIEEVGCSLSGYRDLYQTHHKNLLRRRGNIPIGHPESIATTWSLSFERLEQANPAAVDLLRLCAFLEPDSIPEEMIGASCVRFGSALQGVAADAFLLNEAIEELRKFSLVQRCPETRTLRINRLVQTVVKDSMSVEVQRSWAERAVRATNTVFPQQIEVIYYSQYRRYLPQAQACHVLIQEYALSFDEAASLLFRSAIYLQKADALYEQAELLFHQALQIREQTPGSNHFDVTQILTCLADLYTKRGKCKQAELFYQ